MDVESALSRESSKDGHCFSQKEKDYLNASWLLWVLILGVWMMSALEVFDAYFAVTHNC